MTIGDRKPTATPEERRKLRFGGARQVTIAIAAVAAAILGMIMLAAQ